jgi:hypothetical protein
MKEDRPPILQQDRDGDEQADRREEQQAANGADDIEDALGSHDGVKG